VAIPKRLSQVIQFVLFTGVGAFILYYVYKSQNASYIAECALKGIPEAECSLFEKLKTDFAGANYGWIALVILAYLFSNVDSYTWKKRQISKCFLHHHGRIFC
jgi:hypothetical protein